MLVSMSYNMLDKLIPRRYVQHTLFTQIKPHQNHVKYLEVVNYLPFLKEKCIDFVFLYIMKNHSTIDDAIDAFYEYYSLDYSDYDPETFKRLIGREKQRMKENVIIDSNCPSPFL